jgi:hypothetical protein
MFKGYSSISHLFWVPTPSWSKCCSSTSKISAPFLLPVWVEKGGTHFRCLELGWIFQPFRIYSPLHCCKVKCCFLWPLQFWNSSKSSLLMSTWSRTLENSHYCYSISRCIQIFSFRCWKRQILSRPRCTAFYNDCLNVLWHLVRYRDSPSSAKCKKFEEQSAQRPWDRRPKKVLQTRPFFAKQLLFNHNSAYGEALEL